MVVSRAALRVLSMAGYWGVLMVEMTAVTKAESRVQMTV